MIYRYACIDCLERISGGKKISQMSMEEYIILCDKIEVKVKHKASEKPTITCISCGSINMQKLLGMKTSYIRGYGYTDKKGVHNDMDLHTLTNNRDPYAEHRQPGEKKELERTLRKKKEHNPHRKSVYT